MGVHDEDGERQLSEPPATREELTSLLTKAFTALAKGAGNPLGIVALRMHAEGRPKHQIQIKSELEERSTMRSTWQCTNDTFFVTMQSLAAAKLQIQSLNLFNDTDMKLFALASDQLNLIDWDSPDIAHVLATVTSLNTNISTRVFAFKDRGEDWEEIRAEAENESNFTGLARLVQKCPRLQDFAYQFLGIPLPGLPDLKGFQFPNWKILEYVSELPSLPKLNRLTLRFQHTKESIVLNLLKRTRPGGLFIGPMWLDPGKFKPIFEFCSSPESNMQKLEVRAPLYQMGPEERGQIHFQRQPYNEDAECCAHLRREGEGVRRPIHFHSDPQTFIEVGTSFCNLLLNNSGAFDDSQAHTF
ncbi:f-box domain protein [Fusarium tjaetaba]|uniref:F-box domain protein n=1 Tax=Fusarium tjaetaba TaxID=1567544 RepID=A0A8H5S6S3_9HYPO|nr:f-box domain protein [Fusarium tjaetaba]KAF5646407.1 f-box domain protein [Fusarium tjaetaba]